MYFQVYIKIEHRAHMVDTAQHRLPGSRIRPSDGKAPIQMMDRLRVAGVWNSPR